MAKIVLRSDKPEPETEIWLEKYGDNVRLKAQRLNGMAYVLLEFSANGTIKRHQSVDPSLGFAVDHWGQVVLEGAGGPGGYYSKI